MSLKIVIRRARRRDFHAAQTAKMESCESEKLREKRQKLTSWRIDLLQILSVTQLIMVNPFPHKTQILSERFRDKGKVQPAFRRVETNLGVNPCRRRIEFSVSEIEALKISAFEPVF